MLTLRGSCTSLTALCSIFRTAVTDRTASRQSQSARSSEAGKTLPAAVLSRTACTPQISHLALRARASNKLNFNPVVSWHFTTGPVSLQRREPTGVRGLASHWLEGDVCKLQNRNPQHFLSPSLPALPHLGPALDVIVWQLIRITFVIFWYQNSLSCSCSSKHFLAGLLSPLQSRTPKSSAHYYLLILLGCSSCFSHCFLFLQVTVIHQNLSGFEFWLKRQLSY